MLASTESGLNKDVDALVTAFRTDMKVRCAGFRHDIAALRAIAICGVFAYHFVPTVFVNGYLGVDIFFVISGFLIMNMLSKHDNFDIDEICVFYSKRFKRIFPLLYLVLFFSGFILICTYTFIWKDRYYPHLKPATLLYLNFDLANGEFYYFAKNLEKMPFLHLWSLSVEVQFYLIAPLLHILVRFGKFGHAAFIFVLISSFLFYMMADAVISFYHPGARLWQFMLGMAIPSDTSVTTAKNASFYCKIAGVILILAFSNIAFGIILRIFVTFATASIVYFAPSSGIDFSNDYVKLVADISYALYLIHYPVLQFMHYFLQYSLPYFIIYICAFALTVCLSFVTHYVFEKALLRKTLLTNAAVICGFFVGCIICAVIYDPNMEKEILPESEWHLKYISSQYIVEDGNFVYQDPGIPWPFGHFEYDNGTGNKSVIIIGNSYAAQQASVIRRVITAENYSTMDLFSFPQKFVLFDFAIDKTETAWRLIEKKKPDLIFVLLRYNEAFGDYNPFYETDRTTIKYAETIYKLSQLCGKVYIEMDVPFYCERKYMPEMYYVRDFLTNFVDHLERDVSLRRIKIKPLEGSAVRERLKFVTKNCTNCVLLDIQNPFLVANHFRFYDELSDHSYIDNHCHFTDEGLQKIQAYFKDVFGE